MNYFINNYHFIYLIQKGNENKDMSDFINFYSLTFQTMLIKQRYT